MWRARRIAIASSRPLGTGEREISVSGREVLEIGAYGSQSSQILVDILIEVRSWRMWWEGRGRKSGERESGSAGTRGSAELTSAPGTRDTTAGSREKAIFSTTLNAYETPKSFMSSATGNRSGSQSREAPFQV